MSFALCLLSPIPVVKNGIGFQTLDLWVRDLEVQLSHTSRIKLLCPLLQSPLSSLGALDFLPAGIEVVPLEELSGAGVSSAIAGCDVVQVPGVQSWGASRIGRQLIRAARQIGIKSVVGISSNRARSAQLNAPSDGAWWKLKGVLKSASIQLAQRHLTRHADGTFIVGEGLRSLVSPRCKSLHVGTASWIRRSDLEAARTRPNRFVEFPVVRLCIAARLERMKGIHIGIEAVAKIIRNSPHCDFKLTILGAGTELEPLQEQVKTANLSERVQFGGTRSYPTEFFDELRQHGLVLLTNLSDEQPRLIFDAISQGCIPVCPDAPAYRSLGLPNEILYRQGDSSSLATTIARLKDDQNLQALWSKLLAVSEQFTLEGMHAKRAAWIEADVLGRSV
jgi:glycosyltransferase involved in cell wall biosynthesis